MLLQLTVKWCLMQVTVKCLCCS